MPLTRSCPSCEHETAPHQTRCGECGVEVPPELLAIRGSAERIAHSPLRVLLGAFIAALFATALFLAAWKGVGRAAALSQRLNPLEHVGLIAVFAGIPGLFGCLAVVGIIARVMTLAGRRTMTEAVRLIVTADGLTTSSGATRDPSDLIGWDSIEAIECRSQRGLLCIAVHRTFGGQPKELVWFPGTEDEARAIEQQLTARRPTTPPAPGPRPNQPHTP